MPVNLYEILQRPLTIQEVDENFSIVQSVLDMQPSVVAAVNSTAADKIAVDAAVTEATNQAVAATAAAISTGTLANMIQQTNRITASLTIPDGVNAVMLGEFEVSPDVTVTGAGNSTWAGLQ